MDPPPRPRTLSDIPGTILTGSRAPTLVFFLSSSHSNTRASQPRILVDTHLLCRFSFVPVFVQKQYS